MSKKFNISSYEIKSTQKVFKALKIFELGFKVQILDYYMNNWNEINNSIFNSGLKIIW